MTGTWRDTLFVWEGSLELAATSKKTTDPKSNKNKTSDQKKHSNPENAVVQWKGSWVGCEDCPDAATAATPNYLAFQESDMEFEVSAASGELKSSDGGGGFWHYDMSGGSGWDLGEGDEKARHQDHSHILISKHPLLAMKEEDSKHDTTTLDAN